MERKKKFLAHLKRKLRVRKRVKGVPERPRLNVYKSNRHIYAQIIDDTSGRTLATASTLDKIFRDNPPKEGGKSPAARVVGRLIAEKARTIGIDKVVFDRNGFLYHGRLKGLADGAKEGGLKF
ncbi:MAG: 50S ribosomal protein L18 [Deltaproteobacteria bacterium]|nr:50S ribosomal protein L18 [Deltaproteobacteria bacterium]